MPIKFVLVVLPPSKCTLVEVLVLFLFRWTLLPLGWMVELGVVVFFLMQKGSGFVVLRSHLLYQHIYCIIMESRGSIVACKN